MRAEAHAIRTGLRDALRRAFHARGLDAWIGLEVPIVHHEGTTLLADVAVALGADPRPRRAWIANVERRGVDVVVRVVAGGERVAAFEQAHRHCELGAYEAFVFDRVHGLVRGCRRAPDRVDPIVPGARGTIRSRALDVELVPRGERLAVVPCVTGELHDVLERLDRALERVVVRRAPIC